MILMSPDDLLIFKKRLTQLKNTLVGKGKVPEKLLYSTFKLDKNEDLKSAFIPIMQKHDLTVSDGFITFDAVEGNREKPVRAFLKDALPILLKSFKVASTENGDIDTTTVSKKPSAEGIFLLIDQEDIDADFKISGPEGSLTTGESSVKNDLDKGGMKEQELVKPGKKARSAPELKKEVSVKPSSKAVLKSSSRFKRPSVVKLTTHKLAGKVKIKKAAIKNREITKVKLDVDAVRENSKDVVATIEDGVQLISEEDGLKMGLTPPKESKKIVYEYYVCNRCGAETSKFDIIRVGNFLECPNCYFQFSEGEVSIIKKEVKLADKQENASSKTRKAPDSESLIKPSELFKHAKKEREPSLVRPSELFQTGPRENVSVAPNVFDQSGAPEYDFRDVKARAAARPPSIEDTKVHARQPVNISPKTVNKAPSFQPTKIESI